MITFTSVKSQDFSAGEKSALGKIMSMKPRTLFGTGADRPKSDLNIPLNKTDALSSVSE